MSPFGSATNPASTNIFRFLMASVGKPFLIAMPSKSLFGVARPRQAVPYALPVLTK